MEDAIVLLCLASCLGYVVCLGGADDMKHLHHILFENYSTDLRPCIDYSRSTVVEIYLSVSTVLELNLKNQILYIIGFFSFTWTDELLRWRPENFNGIQEVVVPQNKLWKPDMAIYNSIDDNIYVGNDNVLVRISSDGLVRWEPAVNIAVTCKADISKFPFDENICTINLTTWMHDNASIYMKASPVPIAQDQMVQNGQYWVTPAGTFQVYSEYYGKYFETLGFNLKLSRQPNYLVMTFLVPVTLLAVLCVVSFLLSPEEPEKVSVAITVLLSFTVFLGVVDNDLPETSDQLCLIVAYVVLLLVLSFLCVAGNAVVVVVYKRDLKRCQQSSATLQTSPMTPPWDKAEGRPIAAVNMEDLNAASGDNSCKMCSCGVQAKSELSTRNEGIEDDLSPQVDKYFLKGGRLVHRAYRLNKYCLILNSVALVTIIIVFSLLMLC